MIHFHSTICSQGGGGGNPKLQQESLDLYKAHMNEAQRNQL